MTKHSGFLEYCNFIVIRAELRQTTNVSYRLYSYVCNMPLYTFHFSSYSSSNKSLLGDRHVNIFYFLKELNQ